VEARGPFRQLLENHAGEVVLRGLKTEGLQGGLRSWRGSLRVENAQLVGAAHEETPPHAPQQKGNGIFIEGGKLKLRKLEVRGFEYGVLVGPNSLVEIEAFVSSGARWAGLALNGAQGRLRRLRIEDAGPMGAIQLLGGKVKAQGLHLVRSQSFGLVLREVEGDIEGLRIEGVAAEMGASGEEALGDGLHIRGGHVSLLGLRFEDVEGCGLFASAGAWVKIEHLSCLSCKLAALVVEREAKAEAFHVQVGGISLAAIEVMAGGRLFLKGLKSQHEPAVRVTCADGAGLRWPDGDKEAVEQPGGECVSWE
jgi:hypothetical protein